MPSLFNPCFLVLLHNHSSSITDLVQSLELYQVPCLMVDDGSNQQAQCVAKTIADRFPWVTLICHEKHIGKGAAIKTGLNYAHLKRFTHVFQIDADDQYCLDDLEAFLILAKSNDGAIICGDAIYENKTSLFRMLRRLVRSSWVSMNALSRKIKDDRCGFRLYPVKPIIKLIQRGQLGNGEGIDTEMLIRSCWNGIPIVSHSVRVRCSQNKRFLSAYREGISSSVLMHSRCFFGMLRRMPNILYSRFTGEAGIDKWD